MVHLITSLSRFVLILLFAVYTYSAFAALKRTNDDTAISFFSLQIFLMLLILYIINIVLFLNTEDVTILILCILETVFIFSVLFIYRFLYKSASFSLTNNMCMLFIIGFTMLTRLDIELAKKQLVISFIAIIITAFIPFIISRVRIFSYLTWLYAVLGLLALTSVKIFGKTEYSANLSLDFGAFTLQPAEIVKIIFVFFVAARFYKSIEFKDIVITTFTAFLHVLILVINKDLGAAFVFLFTYLVMVYVASHKFSYFFLGTALSSLSFISAYHLFSHVRVRVAAWKNPLENIDSVGYQISQSLFAIGTGGWFGSGLYQGMPENIPVVKKDFIFAAVSEELGGVFALCLIFVCISVYLMFMNISICIGNKFYKLIALGLACIYATSVFVSIGGVIKFIPSTGITLPLISYGGSSIMGTTLIFAIIQGLYSYRNHEINCNEEKY